MSIIFPQPLSSPDIRSDYVGFQKLINLKDQVDSLDDEDCTIDMSRVTWFDANVCASFGAILYSLQQSGKKIRIIPPLNSSVKQVFNKNGFNIFLSQFGYSEPVITDIYGTTIVYQRFERQNGTEFVEYVKKHFVGKGIPNMSKLLLSKFRESLWEIFDNAVVHSNTHEDEQADMD